MKVPYVLVVPIMGDDTRDIPVSIYHAGGRYCAGVTGQGTRLEPADYVYSFDYAQMRDANKIHGAKIMCEIVLPPGY